MHHQYIYAFPSAPFSLCARIDSHHDLQGSFRHAASSSIPRPLLSARLNDNTRSMMCHERQARISPSSVAPGPHIKKRLRRSFEARPLPSLLRRAAWSPERSNAIIQLADLGLAFFSPPCSLHKTPSALCPWFLCYFRSTHLLHLVPQTSYPPSIGRDSGGRFLSPAHLLAVGPPRQHLVAGRFRCVPATNRGFESFFLFSLLALPVFFFPVFDMPVRCHGGR